MSYNYVLNLKDLSNRVYFFLRHGKIEKGMKALKELTDYHNELFKLYKNLDKSYFFSNIKRISQMIKLVEQNISNKEGIKWIKYLIKYLESITNYQNVLKDIIKHEIKPLMKRHGYKKKADTWKKENDNYEVIVKIYRSFTNTFDSIQFLFEMEIYDKNKKEHIDVKGHGETFRISNITKRRGRWYKLNPETNIRYLKKWMKNDLEKIVLPYFERFVG